MADKDLQKELEALLPPELRTEALGTLEEPGVEITKVVHFYKRKEDANISATLNQAKDLRLVSGPRTAIFVHAHSVAEDCNSKCKLGL